MGIFLKYNDKIKIQRLRYLLFWADQRFSSNYAFIHINKCGGTSVENALGIPKTHDTARQRIRRVGIKRWQNMYTFSVVRNPYARAISHYHYRRDHDKNDQNILANSNLSIDSWIQATYGDQNPTYFYNPIMFDSCYDWLRYDNGDLAVTDAYRLEELEDNWPKIIENINSDHIDLPSHNKSSYNRKHDYSSIISRESIDIINKRHEPDFKYFRYEML